MSDDTTAVTAIPRALESYPSAADQTLAADLAMRVQIEPFNAIATGVFLLAVLHTFAAARFAGLAHRVQHGHDEEAHAHGLPASPSLRAEALHFLGEVEVVFGLWAVVPFMVANFGWRAIIAIVMSTAVYFILFRQELGSLAARSPVPEVEQPDDDAAGAALLPVPPWVVAVHLAFMAWTVFNAHDPALFLGGFLFFLGFARATAPYQSRIELKTPLLVGFFLAGLVIHGGLQGWWIAPVLGRLPEVPLFLAATGLTAVNDNALITYLATLVPNLGDELKLAVVQGAVVGGGLTVIANAPNPAGQALLGRFFDGGILPLGLLAGALVPTVIAAIVFRLL